MLPTTTSCVIQLIAQSLLSCFAAPQRLCSQPVCGGNQTYLHNRVRGENPVQHTAPPVVPDDRAV